MFRGINRVVISAPFGNYLSLGATPTLGTFTWERRGGFLYRLWRMARTLRPVSGGWVNKLGLPNPGIRAGLKDSLEANQIVSIKGFNRKEWIDLAELVQTRAPETAAIELNLSCPNVKDRPDMTEAYGICSDVVKSLHDLVDRQRGLISPPAVIAKLGPHHTLSMAEACAAAGVAGFHICNTLPVERGGISGAQLHPYALRACVAVAEAYPNLPIIGGGGVYSVEAARRFFQNGASHVAVASALLNPLRWKLVQQIINDPECIDPPVTIKLPLRTKCK